MSVLDYLELNQEMEESLAVSAEAAACCCCTSCWLVGDADGGVAAEQMVPLLSLAGSLVASKLRLLREQYVNHSGLGLKEANRSFVDALYKSTLIRRVLQKLYC